MKKKYSVRTETRSVSVCFLKPKTKILVCFGVSDQYWNNQNTQNCFESNRNNPKFSEKYLNIFSTTLFWLVFCLFRFNWNIEIRCFDIEFKTTETNCFETNRNKPKQLETTQNFMKKYQYMLTIKLFRLVSVCFGSFETPKVFCFVSDSAETSFGCFESKLVSKDTLC